MKITQEKYFTILFFIYFSFTLVRFIFPANFFLTSIVTSVGLVSFVQLSNVFKKKEVPIYVYIFGLIIFVLISAVAVNRYERLGHILLFILANSGIALILSKSYVSAWAGNVVFYSLAFFFLKQAFLGVDPDEAMAVVSHNGISMMILVACVTLYIVLIMSNKEIPLLPAVLTLIISIWGTGRSGILASFILLVGLIFVKFRVKKFLIFLLFTPLIFVYLFFEQMILIAVEIPFFSQAATNYIVKTSGEPEARVGIWANYFNNLDIFRFFFGANVKTDPWPDGQILAYNYHNTFINLHAQTGFMGIITILILGYAILKFYKYNKFLAVLLSALIARWFTDIGLFFESWDFLPFYFIFVLVSQKYLLFQERSSILS